MNRQLAFRALMFAGALLLVSMLLMGLALNDDPPDAISLNGYVKIITYEDRNSGDRRWEVQRHVSGIVYARVDQTHYAWVGEDGAVFDVTEEYVRPLVTVTRFAPAGRWVGFFAAALVVFLILLVLYIHLDYEEYLLTRQSRNVTCPRCGYDWRATSLRQCPECGLGHGVDSLISLMSGGKK